MMLEDHHDCYSGHLEAERLEGFAERLEADIDPIYCQFHCRAV